jgi:hypothetical protein
LQENIAKTSYLHFTIKLGMLTNAQPIPLHIAKRNHELAPGSMETIMEKTQLRCSSKMMFLEAIMKKKKTRA